MKTVTVEQLQRNLQALANQKGARGFERAKALYMDGIMVTDGEGNPIDPADLDVKVMKPTAEANAVAEDNDDKEDMEEDGMKPTKSIADEVREAVRSEISKGTRALERKAAPIVESAKPIYGRVRHLKTADEAYKFGRWAMACLGSKKSAQFCADNGIMVTKGHQENINTAGGFLVPDILEPALITLRDEFGVFRQNARIVPMGSDVLRMPRRTGTVTAYFTGEAASGTESQQAFDQVSLVAKKLMVLTTMTSELSEDNIVALGDGLAGEIAYAMALKEDQCGFNGDGTSTFGGIVGLANAIVAGGTQDSANNTLAGVALGDCRAVVGKLAMWADTPNAKWYMNRATWNNTFLRIAEGVGGVMAGEIISDTTQQKTFYGYPVVLAQAIPAAANNGDVLAFFGDMNLAAYLGDRRGLTVEFSNSALNAFEQDEIAVRGTERFDINCANVGDATVAGAMIKFTI